ncbi:MAG TPA: TIGR04182 family glycosyltransferase, partial [Methanocorpusculum sp.]|nr:TIGR04182 family glycosyltransferase [Methanocorpusculum sp.]
FSTIGVLLSLAGLASGIYVVYDWLHGIEHIPLTILTMLLIVTGILAFMIGLLSDMIVAYHREEIREISLLKAEIEELKRK